MLQVVEVGSLAERNELRIKAVIAKTDRVNSLLSSMAYSRASQDPKTGQAIEAKLEIDPEAFPTAQKPRHVYYHLIDPLKEWLKQDEVYSHHCIAAAAEKMKALMEESLEKKYNATCRCYRTSMEECFR